MGSSRRSGGQWDAYIMPDPTPRLFRKLPDGGYRLIDRVPGGPPIPMGVLEAGEVVIIDYPGQQVEVAYLYDQMLVVRVLDGRPHATPTT